jgi:hypothetical protein
MPSISKKTTLIELAAIVSDALENAGIIATLSGGAAVSIYTGNRYQSVDLDFVTTALVKDLKIVLEPLGFQHSGRPRLSVFEHPHSAWYLEFPPAPLSFGGTYIDPSDCKLIDTGLGSLRIITSPSRLSKRCSSPTHRPEKSIGPYSTNGLFVRELAATKRSWNSIKELADATRRLSRSTV